MVGNSTGALLKDEGKAWERGEEPGPVWSVNLLGLSFFIFSISPSLSQGTLFAQPHRYGRK